MPTARELLEQADALMRRNRADQADDIPLLTDAVPSLAEAPLRAKADAPSVQSTGWPLSGAEDRAPPRPGHGISHEGEPSDWLEIEDAEPSVIGDAPDSVAIVPPVALRRTADEELLQSAEHEEIELTSAADDPMGVEAMGQDSLEAHATGAESARADDAERSGSEVVEIEEIPPGVEEEIESRSFDTAAGGEALAAPAHGYASHPSSAAALAASFAAALPPAMMAAPPAAPDTRWPAMPESGPVVSASDEDAPASEAQATPLGPDDQAHWDGVAEEIRMQVLQRIDLFTDTGLREQLGERLKPIVDRASADLVATINQHVGELLRAYVAEAIEREIERWRRDN
jgi:hypothetical protein